MATLPAWFCRELLVARINYALPTDIDPGIWRTALQYFADRPALTFDQFQKLLDERGRQTKDPTTRPGERDNGARVALYLSEQWHAYRRTAEQRTATRRHIVPDWDEFDSSTEWTDDPSDGLGEIILGESDSNYEIGLSNAEELAAQIARAALRGES